MEEQKKDPLDAFLKSLGGCKQAEIQQLTTDLEEFYGNLTYVLKYGTPWHKKLALEYFSKMKEGMKAKMQTFCEKEGIDIKEVEKFLQHMGPHSPKVQALKTKIATLDETAYEAIGQKKKKPSAKQRRKSIKLLKTLRARQ